MRTAVAIRQRSALAVAGTRAHGRPSDAPLWLFACLTAGLVLRVGLSANVLNLLFSYSAEGGSPIFKIHPGSYLLIFAGMASIPTVLRTTPIRRKPLAIATATLIAAVALLLAIMTLRHDTGGLGYLIDTILIAPMSLIAMARLSVRQRILAGDFVLGVICANAVVVTAEFFLQRHLLPYPLRELTFRPAGLFGHPLEVGLICVAVLPYVFLRRWRPTTRWAVLVVIATTVAMSEARIATIVAACLIVLGLGYTLHGDLQARRISPTALFVLVTTMMIAFPLLIMAGLQLGMFERLSLGLVDQSAYARLNVYDIFNYFSSNDFLYGIGVERAQFYAKHVLGLDTIESSIVMTVALFGSIGAALMLGTVLFFLLSLTFRAPVLIKLGALAFCITALSNNNFTSKGPGMVTVTVLLFAAATATQSRNRQVARRIKISDQAKPYRRAFGERMIAT